MILEHNRETYEEAKKMLLEHRECCVVAATGIGKSNIATEIIQDLGWNALIIAPRASIRDNWTDMPEKYNFAPTISTMTYQYFTRHYKSLYGFDAYIFDEAHHAGAPKWGAAIKEFRKELDTEFVLGLTADPIRYSDHDENNRNIIESVFNNHAVYGHDQKSAIEQGILPRAKYICAIYNIDEAFTKYEAMDLTDELRGRLNYTRTNCEAIEDILRNNIPKKVPIKGIVFVDSINNIDIGVRLARRAFPKEAIHYIHSNLSAAENAETLEMFRKAKSGFIVAVDMLNEGLHIEGINTVIMLRKTGSPTIYTQQIGRSLKANGENVSIFDFVRNDTSIKKVLARIDDTSKYYEEYKKKEGNGTNRRHINISDQFIVKDYATDILKVFEDINKYIKRKKLSIWTEEEDQILRDNYPTMGQNVYKLFDNKKTASSCKHRACKLGILSNNRLSWTEEEDQILRDNYPTMGKEVYKLLKNRTQDACRTRADILGLECNNNWSDDENKIFIDNYPTMGSNVYKLLPRRSRSACINHAKILNIKYNKYARIWTEEEDQILRDNYPTMGKEVYKLLKNRSIPSCLKRARRLELKYIKPKHPNAWTSEEDQILKDNYPIMGSDVYKLLQNRTKGSCLSRADILGISINSHYSEKEDQILKNNYPIMGSDVYKLLPGRSKSSCRMRAHALGITNKARWTFEEDQILRDNYPIMGIESFKLIPHKSKNGCRARVRFLNLYSNKYSSKRMKTRGD